MGLQDEFSEDARVRNTMEVLYLIGFCVGVIVIVWLIRAFRNFLETRKYKDKLRKLTPQINAVDVNELSTDLSKVHTSYYLLKKMLRETHMICDDEEQMKSIYQFVQEEAQYRRSKRKPRKKSYRRKYRSYRRYS